MSNCRARDSGLRSPAQSSRSRRRLGRAAQPYTAHNKLQTAEQQQLAGRKWFMAYNVSLANLFVSLVEQDFKVEVGEWSSSWNKMFPHRDTAPPGFRSRDTASFIWALTPLNTSGFHSL